MLILFEASNPRHEKGVHARTHYKSVSKSLNLICERNFVFLNGIHKDYISKIKDIKFYQYHVTRQQVKLTIYF